METNKSRRDFLKTSAGAAVAFGALNYVKSAGANDRLSIGLIGCGSRMRGGIMPSVNNYAKSENAEIIAVCDPWRVAREEAAAMCKDWFGREPLQYTSYRQLLDESGVDVVMIASCDHLHTTHLKAAAQAKKDAYCEKPLAKSLEMLKETYDAVKANNVVVQAGTQVRSFPSTMAARQFYSTGALGKVGRIEQCRNAARPYWYSYIREVREEDVDWAEFLADRPMRPFDPVVYSGWYGYREFSDGPIPGLASHYVDLIHSITGARFPRSVVAMSGTYVWKDEHKFDAPDHATAAWEYDEGFIAHYSTYFGNGGGNSLKIFGDQGIMDLTDWNNVYISSDGAQGESKLSKEQVRLDDVQCPDHVENWLQCVRTRKSPNADIDAGYQHAVAVLMAVRASDTGKRQVYDHETREIREG
jgi:predicted dehydrogenase